MAVYYSSSRNEFRLVQITNTGDIHYIYDIHSALYITKSQAQELLLYANFELIGYL